MTAQEESHETKQGQDEDRHEPRFLVSPALKVKSLPADRLLASQSMEIAAIEAQIRAGHPDLQGLCLALSDWSAELRLLEKVEVTDGTT
jgi:hypothetical protein